MKILKTLSMILLCCSSNHYYTLPRTDHQNIIPLIYNLSPVVDDLQLQKNLSECRLFFLPVLLGITSCLHYQNIKSLITDYPISFVMLSLFSGNYFLDTISRYRQIKQTLHFFLFSQAMARYILSTLAVKNHLKKVYEKRHQSFDELYFEELFLQNTGQTIEELEKFTFELINTSITAINNLCIDINTTGIEEKIYFLFKEKITLEQMLMIAQKDKTLYEALITFYNDPNINQEAFLKKIAKLIQKQLDCFI